MKKFKKTIALIMSIIMAITCLPAANVFASSSGTEGNTITYTYSGNTLTISGTGAMTDYDSGKAPWYSKRTVISSVVIKDGVTSIGSNAFYSFTRLRSIIIPDSVTSIGGNAFYSCENLSSITISDSVTSIGYNAFYDCSFSTAGPTGGGYDYEFEWTDTIPDNAFNHCTGLSSAVIPDSITKIGNYAFSRCINLSGFTMPEDITSIGSYAFSGCTGLKSIIIPDGAANIGSYAFSGCNSLKSISVPESVTSIGDYAFNNCSISTAGPIGGGYDYEYGWKEAIPDNAFRGCTKLSSIAIPEGIKGIGKYALYKCTGLSSITIPEGVTDIDSYAFSGCTSLSNITVPGSVINIGDSVLSGCSISTAGPSGGGYDCEYGWTDTIPGNTFRNCTSLNSVTVPEGITSIGSYAFSGCTGLSSITVPGSVTSIGDYAFYNCNLSTAGPTGGGYDYEFGWTETIPENAFRRCTGLSSAVIPEGTASIGRSAFLGCTGLVSVDIPEGITSIYGYAFYGCTSLSSITIPEGVTSINSYALCNCTSLSSVTVPGSVINIGDSVLSGCSLSTAGPAGGGYDYEFGWTDTIPDNAFHNCTYINSIALPEDTEAIGDNAFYNCTNLTGINLPDSLTSIGGYAFFNCKSLGSIDIPRNVTSIRSFAFYNCEALSSIIVPDSITSIGSYTFYNCKALSGIAIPDGLKRIGNYAFYNCKALSGITIPDGLKSIGSYVFYNCTDLSSITIPDSVTSIGAYAFYNCTGLSSITIPESVTNISDDAFFISGLTEVYCYEGSAADNPNLYPDDVDIIYLESSPEAESDSPYSFVVDKDLSESDVYQAGDTVYEDGYITYNAVLKLSVNAGSGASEIGGYSYTNSLVCSSTNTSITLDGAVKNRRIHSSITAQQDCVAAIVTAVPSGRELAVAEKNSDGTYTALKYYDGTSYYGNTEIVLKLTAGQTVYIMGQAVNPCIYAVNAASAGDADGNHVTEVADAVTILQYAEGETALTEAEFAAADMNNDGVVDKTDAALVLRQLIS